MSDRQAIAQGGGAGEVRLGTVTVTFHPDLALLRAQLRALPQGALRLIVDNGSAAGAVQGLKELQQEFPALMLHLNAVNVGLAEALDQGVRMLADLHDPCTHVLLLDQDSEPHHRAIPVLLDVLARLERSGLRPGAVGPQLLDPGTGLMHGFHCMTRWRWSRVFPSLQQEPIPVANLNGSGTLMRTTTYLRCGGLDRELFIDHVDTEWSFRLLHAGYTLWGVPSAVFGHRMGERGLRWWMFGWRIWPVRSPHRHRYLFRNTVRLMRRPYVPRVWKVWASVKLVLTLVVCVCFDAQRVSQAQCMWRGVRDGLGRGNGRG